MSFRQSGRICCTTTAAATAAAATAAATASILLVPQQELSNVPYGECVGDMCKRPFSEVTFRDRLRLHLTPQFLCGGRTGQYLGSELRFFFGFLMDRTVVNLATRQTCGCWTLVACLTNLTERALVVDVVVIIIIIRGCGCGACGRQGCGVGMRRRRRPSEPGWRQNRRLGRSSQAPHS